MTSRTFTDELVYIGGGVFADPGDDRRRVMIPVSSFPRAIQPGERVTVQPTRVEKYTVWRIVDDGTETQTGLFGA